MKKTLSILLILAIVTNLTGCIKREPVNIGDLVPGAVYGEKDWKYVAKFNKDNQKKIVTLKYFSVENQELVGPKAEQGNEEVKIPLSEITSLEKAQIQAGLSTIGIVGGLAAAFILIFGIIFSQGFNPS